MTKAERLEAERVRTALMKQFEDEYRVYGNICGVDEAGRGPLCGPVVAGAVILPKDCDILYLNDSKKISENKREEIYEEIMAKAISVGIGFATPERIDEINIRQADFELSSRSAAFTTKHSTVHINTETNKVLILFITFPPSILCFKYLQNEEKYTKNAPQKQSVEEVNYW